MTATDAPTLTTAFYLTDGVRRTAPIVVPRYQFEELTRHAVLLETGVPDTYRVNPLHARWLATGGRS